MHSNEPLSWINILINSVYAVKAEITILSTELEILYNSGRQVD
jgi:hypothetical protein